MPSSKREDFIQWINQEIAIQALADTPNLASFIYAGIDEKKRFIFDERKGTAEICLEVVGTQYEGRSKRIESVSAGTAVKLVREPNNAYNSNNIAVQNQRGESLGNMPADLANVLSPLLDGGEASIIKAAADYVEPLSKRSAKAKKAILYVAFTVSLKKQEFSNASGCTVCLLGGDQIHGWFQSLEVLHCAMSVEQAALIFELYNRAHDEYDMNNNDTSYLGLDNLDEEVTEARRKMRTEMKPSLDYSGPRKKYDGELDFIRELLEKDAERYASVKRYFYGVDGYGYLRQIFKSDSLGSENYFWIDQAPVTQQEFDRASGFGFSHWYDVAELFRPGKLPVDLDDDDTVSIFGTHQFAAFADLSYGC